MGVLTVINLYRIISMTSLIIFFLQLSTIDGAFFPGFNKMERLPNIEHNMYNTHQRSYHSSSIIQQIRVGGDYRKGTDGKNTKYSSTRINNNHNQLMSNRASSSSASSTDLEAPNVKKIISFAIPAIGIWLCGPLLSLIDTSAVGLLSGTAQQAALNPAITITEDGALLVSFMYTATTNLVAAAFEYDRQNDEEKSRTITTVITSLQLSLIVGLIFGITLGSSATYLIKTLIGKKQVINLEVLSAAEKYVRIRALGMPAAVIIGSAQSACLGMKDTRSPLIVMIAAAFVNLLGDILFVRNKNPWLGGAAGAAWATVFSQYAAMFMFLNWLNVNNVDESKELKIAQMDSDSFSTRGVLHGRFHYRDLIKLPSSYATVKKFLQYAVPVTTTAIGRVSGYVAMSHVVSSALGTSDLAAQQIVLAFFFCFVPMADSLNLTAQSFVPGIFEYKGDSKLRRAVLNQTVKNFLKAGSIFGIVLMGVVSCIPLVSNFFSLDPSVILSVNSTTIYIAIYALLSGLVCAGEGLLLGQKDLKFLSTSFTAFFFTVPYFLMRVKHAALKGIQGIGLATVWRVFTIYQIVRCSMWLVRIRQLSKISNKELLD